MRTSVLDQALPDWPNAAADAERLALLDVSPRYVAFRHELARTAILESLPAATRRAHHAEILRALLATGADAAERLERTAALFVFKRRYTVAQIANLIALMQTLKPL